MNINVPDAQYMRIESIAGGIPATDRQFIRACHSIMSKRARKQHGFRRMRHGFIRTVLAKRDGIIATGFWR